MTPWRLTDRGQVARMSVGHLALVTEKTPCMSPPEPRKAMFHFLGTGTPERSTSPADDFRGEARNLAVPEVVSISPAMNGRNRPRLRYGYLGLPPDVRTARYVTGAVLHFLTVPYDQGRMRYRRSQKLCGLVRFLSRACRSSWSFFWFCLISESVN